MRMYTWSLYNSDNTRSCILTYHGEWGFGSALPLIPVLTDAESEWRGARKKPVLIDAESECRFFVRQ